MKMFFISDEREKVNDLLADYRASKNICSDKQQELAEQEDYLTYIGEAYQITQQVAGEIQHRVHKQISSVVSRCLETVFYDKDYGLKINFIRLKSRTSVVLMLTLDGHEIVNPLNNDSGAVCEVAGCALRLSCLAMSKPKLRKLLVLDEPFKSLSAEYWDGARRLIRDVAKIYGVQIIMVTHNPKLQTGKIVEL